MTEPDYHGSLRSALLEFASVCGAFTGTGHAASGRPADPSPVEARPVLLALIETVLPFDAPRFPLAPEIMLAHCETLFTMRIKPTRIWRESLLTFNASDAFPRPTAPALAEERRALQAYPANTPERVRKQLEQKRGQDEKLLEFFQKKGMVVRPFAEMDASERRGYFWLWSQSGFSLKRRFHKACRGAILASAYAAPELGAYPDRAGGRD